MRPAAAPVSAPITAPFVVLLVSRSCVYGSFVMQPDEKARGSTSPAIHLRRRVVFDAIDSSCHDAAACAASIERSSLGAPRSGGGISRAHANGEGEPQRGSRRYSQVVSDGGFSGASGERMRVRSA